MDQPIQLIPLVCLRCTTPVPANPDEVAWVCAQCAQGMWLDDEKGLQPLEVNYAAGIPPNAMGRPFWVADGRVGLRRESYGSGGKQTKEALEFWGTPRRFFVPAFTATLEQLLAQATDLLLKPPLLQPGPAARFQPVTLSPAEVQPAAEFIVLAIEAGRKDKLKKIDIQLNLSPPTLWILP